MTSPTSRGINWKLLLRQRREQKQAAERQLAFKLHNGGFLTLLYTYQPSLANMLTKAFPITDEAPPARPWASLGANGIYGVFL